jgi:16S rRNA (cytidine1402-2'-O)-methyltransferase
MPRGAAIRQPDPEGKSDPPNLALTAGLYVVATPIGNLSDITMRALEALKAATLVAAEDTRHTGRLLAHFGLKKKLISYHEHSSDSAAQQILEAAIAGPVALVSDAGTPLISDPGYRLVAEARARAIPVWPIPGACAAVAALSVSGLPTDRFLFAGFMPPKTAARRQELTALAQVSATLVLYEAPTRLADCLADAAFVLGDRPALVARELTKLHEEHRSGGLAELARHYAQSGAPKGEIVVIIGRGVELAATQADVLAQLKTALASLSVKDAAQQVAAATGRSKSDIYRLALELKASQ